MSRFEPPLACEDEDEVPERLRDLADALGDRAPYPILGVGAYTWRVTEGDLGEAEAAMRRAATAWGLKPRRRSPAVGGRSQASHLRPHQRIPDAPDPEIEAEPAALALRGDWTTRRGRAGVGPSLRDIRHDYIRDAELIRRARAGEPDRAIARALGISTSYVVTLRQRALRRLEGARVAQRRRQAAAIARAAR